MSNVVKLPVSFKPHPVESFAFSGNAHVDAERALRIWEQYALQNCGADWTAKILEDRLWRARTRRSMENPT